MGRSCSDDIYVPLTTLRQRSTSSTSSVGGAAATAEMEDLTRQVGGRGACAYRITVTAIARIPM